VPRRATCSWRWRPGLWPHYGPVPLVPPGAPIVASPSQRAFRRKLCLVGGTSGHSELAQMSGSRSSCGEEVAVPVGDLPPTLAARREAGADMQAGGTGMLCPSVEVEAELLELDSKRAIDGVGPIASDVDDHFRCTVLKNATDCRGEARLVRPTQWSRVSGGAACTFVMKVESTVLDSLLSHLSASTQ
jgi:hypothetical protein